MGNDLVVGIDLGTTNSEVAAFLNDRVQVIDKRGESMLPSCVGLSPAGELLVGQAARRQQLVYPERTAHSIKRNMGSDTTVSLGEQTFTPQEISGLILHELTGWAEAELGERPEKAVITVPAYFSDAQRQATREAGQLAGLEVLRIINEPTAASLAYGHDGDGHELVMVYDLGGGTFDVSLVRLEGEVTEVLSSHGNNHLGGDDFTQRLVDWLLGTFQQEHGVDLRNESAAGHSRLWWAAEEAKKTLSAGPYATVREENLLTHRGKALHLEVEVSRAQYDGLIRDLAESTLESVTRAMRDADVSAADIDSIVLVGGSTRTPLIVDMLTERSGKTPRQEVHPDLCVALGAGVMASRLAGHEVERVLVDVCPYSFGISHLGERGGFPYPHCYSPTIDRNTALPVTRTSRYWTSHPYQEAVEIEIYQGEDPDALRNIPVGDFLVEGLTPTREPNEILCRMALDLNGILHVSAIEKATGLSKHITIQNGLTPKSDEEICAARARLEEIYGGLRGSEEDLEEGEAIAEEEADRLDSAAGKIAPEIAEEESRKASELEPELDAALLKDAEMLTAKSRSAFEHMHAEDKEEAIELHETIAAAAEKGDAEALEKSMEKLRELLFFVEGAR